MKHALLSQERCLAQSRALEARAAIERLSPSRFRAFAEWLELADTFDDEEDVESAPTTDNT